MNTHTVRKALRAAVYGQFYCCSDGALINGLVWDLSEAGVTGDCPVPVGLETTSS